MYKLLTDTKHRSNALLKIHVTEDNISINDKIFNLDELKTKNDYRSFCNIVFPLGNMFKIVTRLEKDGQLFPYYNSPVLEPFDSYTQSYNSKSKYLNHLFPALDMPVSILFYPETKNFKDALLVILKQEDHVPLEVTTTDNSDKVIPYVPDYEGPYISYSVLPKCLLSSELDIVSNEGTTLHFTYRDINSVEQNVNFVATAKCDKGYVSHSKFDVKEGKGSFKFIPLGLSSGEKVKIQVGIGKYTNIVSKTLVVK